MNVPPFPVIPAPLLDDYAGGIIEPCPEVRDWAREAFIDGLGELVNADHDHLREASIEFLWTNVPLTKRDKRIIGTAQLGEPTGTAWIKAQRAEQLFRWFARTPDFLITLDAVYLSTASPEQLCALIEHELYHCHFAVDIFGVPKMTEEGEYRWSMRGHDVEQFVGVIQRYGPTDELEERFIEAAKEGPQFTRLDLGGVCGLCHG